MIDSTQPHNVFSGKDDVYRLLRETREAVNILEGRVKELEKDEVWRNCSKPVGKLEDVEMFSNPIYGDKAMANTKGNSGMVPSVQTGKGGKRK